MKYLILIFAVSLISCQDLDEGMDCQISGYFTDYEWQTVKPADIVSTLYLKDSLLVQFKVPAKPYLGKSVSKIGDNIWAHTYRVPTYFEQFGVAEMVALIPIDNKVLIKYSINMLARVANDISNEITPIKDSTRLKSIEANTVVNIYGAECDTVDYAVEYEPSAVAILKYIYFNNDYNLIDIAVEQ